MAIALNGTPVADAGNYDTSRTFSYTNNGGAVLLGITFGYEDNNNLDPSTVTYAGAAMTKIAGYAKNTTKNARTALYLKTGAATGANNVVVSWTSGAKLCVFVVSSWDGVDTSTPTGTPATATGATGTATVNVTSATGEVVVDVCSTVEQTGAPGTLTANQTTLTSGRSAESALGNEGEGQYAAGATSVTMSYGVSGTLPRWAIAAVALKPAAGGGGLDIPIAMAHYQLTQ